MILRLVDFKGWGGEVGLLWRTTDELLGVLDISPILDQKMRLEARDAHVDNLIDSTNGAAFGCLSSATRNISLLEHSADFLFPRSSHLRAGTERSSAGLRRASERPSYNNP
jgi:hypothetical protein